MADSKIWRFLRRLGIGGRETKIDEFSRLYRLGRDEWKYVEGERSLVLFIELLVGSPEFSIHSSSIRQWLSPYQHQQIGEEERHRIASKIAKFLVRQGYSVEIR